MEAKLNLHLRLTTTDPNETNNSQQVLTERIKNKQVLINAMLVPSSEW